MLKLFKIFRKDKEPVSEPPVKKISLKDQLRIAEIELQRIKPTEDAAAYIRKFHQIIDLKQKISNGNT